MKKTENLVYAIIWSAVFLLPLLRLADTGYLNTIHYSPWNDILRTWSFVVPLFILFLLHNFFAAPLLIYKHRKKEYIIFAGGLFVIFTIYVFLVRDTNAPLPPGPSRTGIFPPESMPHPGDISTTRPLKIPLRPLAPDMVKTIFALLIIGFNIAIKYFFKSFQDERDMEEMKKENLETQLKYLKYQISPHFFMNTLNNIHAQVDIDPEKAKDSILRLSRLMRYMLYEGEKQTIPMEKEISFLDEYISLMKLRYSDMVKIRLTVAETFSGMEIPPLLFISFVENAFKHGISYQKNSFIEVELSKDADAILFRCRNSRLRKDEDDSEGGIGIENTVNRLDLLYGDRYSLDITKSDEAFCVDLRIPPSL